jgi:hypothetical protein
VLGPASTLDHEKRVRAAWLRFRADCEAVEAVTFLSSLGVLVADLLEDQQREISISWIAGLRRSLEEREGRTC